AGVHVVPSPADSSRALKVMTAIVPRAEVRRTEAPTEKDIPALASVELDMKVLASLDASHLVQNLRPLVDAYDAWLDGQQATIDAGGDGLDPNDPTTKQIMTAARDASRRLRLGIELLGTNAVAAEAFRFANDAMWRQRVHT